MVFLQLVREDFDSILFYVNKGDCMKGGWVFFVACKGRILLPHSRSDLLGGRWCCRELPTHFLSGHHFETETTKKQGILFSCSIHAGSWKAHLRTAKTACTCPRVCVIMVATIEDIKCWSNALGAKPSCCLCPSRRHWLCLPGLNFTGSLSATSLLIWFT